MKKTVFAFNILLLLATLLSACFYYLYGGLALKALTSSGFVLVGIVNLFYTLKAGFGNKGFAILMAGGLVFSLLADIVLNIEFLIGAVIFAIAHIFYLTAFCRLCRFMKTDLIPIGIIFAVSSAILLLYPNFNFGGGLMKVICIVYALILSFTVGKAIANTRCIKPKIGFTLLIGSLLFFISDIALVFYVFAGAAKVADTVCLVTYFPAQCVFAVSMLLNACDNK